MHQTFVFVLAVWCSVTYDSVVAITNVQQAFIDHQITPRIVNTAPAKLIFVRYRQTGAVVQLGNEIPLSLAQGVPEFYYEEEPNSYYTFVIIDPDAPNRQCPIEGEWLHGLITNIPSGAPVTQATIIADYIGPRPGANTGYHRLIFLLYKQPRLLTFNVNISRRKFSVDDFAMRYGLGKPVAGNFFYTSGYNTFFYW